MAHKTMDSTGEHSFTFTSREIRKFAMLVGIVGSLLTAGMALATARAQLAGKADQAQVDSLSRTVEQMSAAARFVSARFDEARATRDDVASILRYLCVKATPTERRLSNMRCP